MAKFYCRNRNSNLISLHSDEEWAFVTNKIIDYNTFPDDLWTGGYKYDEKLYWDDDSPLDVDPWKDTMWAYGNPDGAPDDCLYLWNRKGYRLADTDCESQPKPFVCKMNTGMLEL